MPSDRLQLDADSARREPYARFAQRSADHGTQLGTAKREQHRTIASRLKQNHDAGVSAPDRQRRPPRLSNRIREGSLDPLREGRPQRPCAYRGLALVAGNAGRSRRPPGLRTGWKRVRTARRFQRAFAADLKPRDFARRRTKPRRRRLPPAVGEAECRAPGLRERAPIDRRKRGGENADLELLRHHRSIIAAACNRALIARLPS